jgi:undecaprenyl-diphosphatase
LLINANIDKNLYDEIHTNWKSPTLDVIMGGTEAISGYPGLALIQMGVLYFGKEKEIKTARIALTAWAIGTLATVTTKVIVNRPRPENDSPPRWDSSFPSLHTSSWFSMAVVYADKYPKLTIPLYSFGILVGLSRVYQGRHYPSDVLAGAILGWASGQLTLRLEKKLNRFFER